MKGYMKYFTQFLFFCKNITPNVIILFIQFIDLVNNNAISFCFCVILNNIYLYRIFDKEFYRSKTLFENYLK